MRGGERGRSRGNHGFRFPRCGLQARREMFTSSSEGGAERGNHGFARVLNAPRPVVVEASPVGVPVRVNREMVALLREEWRVVDRWWTEAPVDRRYFDLVLESGQNACVFRDEEAGCWFSQRA